MTPKNGPAALISARQLEAAISDVSASLGHHPEWADLWNLRGLMEAFQGKFDSAVASFEEALRRNESYSAAAANLTWANGLAAGNPPLYPASDDAAGAFLALLQAASGGDVDPSETARRQLALAMPGVEDLLATASLEKDGRLVLARFRGLGQPQYLNPGLADLLLRCARLEGIAGRSAEEARLQALGALYRGDRALYLLERGEAASRQGRSEDALQLLRAAVEARPDWHQCHQALGYELSVRGIQAEALHHFEQATRLEPAYADVQYQYGLLLHAAGRDEEAILVMGRALALNPSYVVARIALGNLLFEVDRPAEAVPHFEHALEEGIDTAALIGRFGFALHAAGNRNRAEELFLEAIARHHERPELLALYGQFLAETDRKMEARAVWKRALDANPPEWIRAEIEAMRDEIPADPRSDRS